MSSHLLDADMVERQKRCAEVLRSRSSKGTRHFVQWIRRIAGSGSLDKKDWSSPEGDRLEGSEILDIPSKEWVGGHDV